MLVGLDREGLEPPLVQVPGAAGGQVGFLASTRHTHVTNCALSGCTQPDRARVELGRVRGKCLCGLNPRQVGLRAVYQAGGSSANREAERGQDSFLGLPRGRTVLCNSRRAALLVAQPSSPNGQLRRRQFRNTCNSASVCGSFTQRSHGRGSAGSRGVTSQHGAAPAAGRTRPGRTPPPLLRTRHQLGPHRIPLDIPQHRQQMRVGLDRRGFGMTTTRRSAAESPARFPARPPKTRRSLPAFQRSSAGPPRD